MIDEVEVELNGRIYAWHHDPEVKSPDRSWVWSGATSGFRPPESTQIELNRLFLNKIQAVTPNQIKFEEIPRFVAILRSMGATDDDFDSELLRAYQHFAEPDRARIRKFRTLPPATHTPFNCVALRNWLLGASSLESIEPPQAVTLLGQSPFEADEFRRYLANLKITHANDALGHVILGRDDWAEEEIDEVIERHRGQSLRVYSQEMFVLMLACKRDVFVSDPDVMEAFRAGHAGLEFVSEGWAGWVSTQIPFEGTGRQHANVHWQTQSPLGVLGYRVGVDRLSELRRHEILDTAYLQQLPNVGTPGYMNQWGQPRSAARLKKIANFLAYLCRNMKKRQAASGESIRDWEADLEWLRQRHYHGAMTFSWPSTRV